jgi:hypothetical protein
MSGTMERNTNPEDKARISVVCRDTGETLMVMEPGRKTFTLVSDDPIYQHLDPLRKSIKLGQPMLPTGELVYFIGAGEFVKIGFTASLTVRVCDLQVANPHPLRILACIRGDRDLEYDYHQRFADCRHFGEWFRLTPELQAEIDRLNEVAA